MSLWPIHLALHTRLTGDASLTALLPAGANSILDHVPAGTALPYVTLGDMRLTTQGTQTFDAIEAVATIQTFSRGAGSKELRGIMEKIRACLHRADFTVPGHALVLCEEISADVALDADGVTRRGTQTFRLIAEAF